MRDPCETKRAHPFPTHRTLRRGSLGRIDGGALQDIPRREQVAGDGRQEERGGEPDEHADARPYPQRPEELPARLRQVPGPDEGDAEAGCGRRISTLESGTDVGEGAVSEKALEDEREVAPRGPLVQTSSRRASDSGSDGRGRSRRRARSGRKSVANHRGAKNAKSSEKPLRAVATHCLKERMVRRGRRFESVRRLT
jgi:hypothetical protein